MSAISGLVSASLSIYGGSTQSVSAARQAAHVFLTATEYDLQLNYRHVIPITGAPFSPRACCRDARGSLAMIPTRRTKRKKEMHVSYWQK